MQRVKALTVLSGRRANMSKSQTPYTSQRRVRVYDRLGEADDSPPKTIGMVLVALIILIGMIMALT
jgi:hypothetical protein